MPFLTRDTNDQSDVKRPVSPPAGAVAASAYSVNRPHGANAVRYVNLSPFHIVTHLDMRYDYHWLGERSRLGLS